ncbi:MAG: hypothetical protein HYX32_08550 [Actinobacteria bacterium]|nr:hypothetical protein [Actinomycetota bacterium]
MSSLWTPGGEVPVNPKRVEPQTEPRAATPSGPASGGDELSLDDLTPEQREQAKEMMAQMAEAQRQIAATPANQIVATHAAGLYELAAIKLGQEPPMLDDARLAIDGLAALIDACGDRLGDDGAPLRDAVRNLQIAFVQIKERAGS